MSIIFLVASGAFANSEWTGTTSGNFLKISGGVRAAGMGDTFVGLADDSSAIYWNPAGITQVKSGEFSTAYTNWFQGVSIGNIFLVQNTQDYGSFGFSAAYLSAGAIEETTVAEPGGTGAKFNPSDMVLGFSYAKEVAKYMSVGLNIKHISDSININSDLSGSVCTDIGFFTRRIFVKGLSMGIAVRNIGYMAGSPLPLVTTFGVGYRTWLLMPMNLVLDVNMPADNTGNVHAGMEYRIFKFLCLRLGCKSNGEENAGGSFSAGLGFTLQDLVIDYAYAPYGDLGESHRISLGLKF